MLQQRIIFQHFEEIPVLEIGEIVVGNLLLFSPSSSHYSAAAETIIFEVLMCNLLSTPHFLSLSYL